MVNGLIRKYKNMPEQVKASIWFLICAFLQKALSMITTPIFTRLMSTYEYGRYNIFISWQSIVAVVVSLNLFYGVYTQGLVKYEKEKEEYAASLQMLCTSCIILFFSLYILFRDYLNRIFSMTTGQMVAMFFMIWASSVFSFWSVRERVEGRYKKLVVLTLSYSIVSSLANIILVFLGNDKVNARIYGTLIIELLFYMPLFVIFIIRSGLKVKKEFIIYALKFNIPLIPHYLSQSILSSSDRIMIDKIVDSKATGIYSLAYSVSMIMVIFNTSFMQTIEPWLYKRIKCNESYKIKKLAYPVFVVVAILNLFLIFLAPEVINIFAPKGYSAAKWLIAPIAMSVFFMFVYNFFAVFEFYFNKSMYITQATTIGAVINIVLNYIFINLYGYIAAAYTTLVCYILYAIFHYICMNKICKEQEIKNPFDKLIVISFFVFFVLAGFIMMFTYEMGIIRYIMVAIIMFILLLCRRKIAMIINRILEIKKER